MKIAEKNKHKRFDTEFLFHSILQASYIQSPVVDTTLSIFR